MSLGLGYAHGTTKEGHLGWGALSTKICSKSGIDGGIAEEERK